MLGNAFDRYHRQVSSIISRYHFISHLLYSEMNVKMSIKTSNYQINYWVYDYLIKKVKFPLGANNNNNNKYNNYYCDYDWYYHQTRPRDVLCIIKFVKYSLHERNSVCQTITVCFIFYFYLVSFTFHITNETSGWSRVNILKESYFGRKRKSIKFANIFRYRIRKYLER